MCEILSATEVLYDKKESEWLLTILKCGFSAHWGQTEGDVPMIRVSPEPEEHEDGGDPDL